MHGRAGRRIERAALVVCDGSNTHLLGEDHPHEAQLPAQAQHEELPRLAGIPRSQIKHRSSIVMQTRA